MPSARLEPAGADGLVVLLRIEENAIAYAFDEDAEELLAAQLPPLPSGELLRLGTLPADGENSTGASGTAHLFFASGWQIIGSPQ